VQELNLFEQVKKLSDDYYNNYISFEEYRQKRNTLLKQIDAGYNGAN